MSNRISNFMSKNMPEKNSESMAGRMLTLVSESMSETMSERMLAYMSDRISEYMKIYAMSEYMPDRSR
jgi:hypothetical protein